MDLRAHLERMRDVQTAQHQALVSEDDLRLDALLDEMYALVAALPDGALDGCDDPSTRDLALSVRAAQDELMRLADERRARARGLLQGLDQGRSALAAYGPSLPVSITDRSA